MVIVGSVVYHNFSIIFLYLYSKGPLFEMFLFLVIVVDGGCINLFQNTHGLYFRAANGLAGKANTYLFFYIYYH